MMFPARTVRAGYRTATISTRCTWDIVDQHIGHPSTVFADNGSFTVRRPDQDKDNAPTIYTTVVTVNNVAPTITPIVLRPASKDPLIP